MKHIGVLAVLALLVLSPATSATSAEETRSLPPFGENVKIMLDASIGRTVTLQLSSGQEISGTVTKVGDHVVQLSRVVGRDYYDALVVLERVNAVFFKVVGK